MNIFFRAKPCILQTFRSLNLCISEMRRFEAVPLKFSSSLNRQRFVNGICLRFGLRR